MKKFLTFLFLVALMCFMGSVFGDGNTPSGEDVIGRVGTMRRATGRPAMGILPSVKSMTDEESAKRFVQQYGTPSARGVLSRKLRLGSAGKSSEKMDVTEWLSVFGQRDAEVKPVARAASPKLALKTAPRDPVIEEKWVTTVTTNSDESLTIVLTKGTNTVTRFWHNAPVPFKWRAKFHELATDEDKANAISDITTYLTETQPESPIHTKATEPVEGDQNLTAETYIIYGR